MRRMSRLAVVFALPVLLLIQPGAAAAAPVSVAFSGIMADTAFDPLGAFGPADADLAGETMRTTISFDTTLAYTASGSDDQYTDTAPGSGAITIAITIGGVTLTQTSTYAGLLEAISIGADTEAFGDAAAAPGDMLGYGIASTAPWSAGMMATSASFETLLTQADPDQVQYLQVGTAPGQWEYLVFTATDPQIIAEPAATGLLAVALLVLGILRRRPPRTCRPAHHLC
jgi:preprotein translocase subunit SecG